MTNIEKYQSSKSTHGRIVADVNRTLGRDSPNNDKKTFYVKYVGLSNAMFAPMQFTIDCSYGYYGSSSGYSATSDDLGKYLALSISHHKTALLDHAVALAKADMEKAQKAAVDEANEVLSLTKSPDAAIASQRGEE